MSISYREESLHPNTGKTQRQTHTNINTHKHLIQTNTKKTIKLDISIPEKGRQF